MSFQLFDMQVWVQAWKGLTGSRAEKAARNKTLRVGDPTQRLDLAKSSINVLDND